MANNNTILGIVLIALGALILLGFLDIPFLTEILAVAAIVVGILILMGKMAGSSTLAVIVIILGALLLFSNPIGSAISQVVGTILDIIIGVALIILGILRLK